MIRLEIKRKKKHSVPDAGGRRGYRFGCCSIIDGGCRCRCRWLGEAHVGEVEAGDDVVEAHDAGPAGEAWGEVGDPGGEGHCRIG